MFKKMMLLAMMAIGLVQTVGATTTQQNPIPQCSPCTQSGSGN
jgi:hypothetical protein